jgi:signal transduction histidine kinase/CheY-like chemotaxis protein
MTGVPVLLLAVGLAVIVTRDERVTAQRGLAETTRAIQLAIDRELWASITTLQAVATSEHLDRRDFRAFYDAGRRVVGSQTDWYTMTLIEVASGKTLLTTARPFGDPLPSLIDRPHIQRAIATRKPQASDYLQGRTIEGQFISVVVPVVRGARVEYVLAALYDFRILSKILAGVKLPTEWTGAVLDRNHVIIARTRLAEQFVGQRAAATLGTQAAEMTEGLFEDVDNDGVANVGAFARLSLADWTVVVGAPAGVLFASVRRSVGIVIGSGLAVLALGVAAAVIYGRRITSPVMALAESAAVLGSGAPPPRVVSSVDEIQVVSDAIVTAAEQRLRAEREAREANTAKDEFLATLSHELRTPLNAIWGWARMLRAGAVDTERTAHALATIERNAEAQSHLVEDLLDVSRIITGKMRLDTQTVDLHLVITAALDAVRPAAEAKDIRVHSVLDPRAGPITGDPARLQQVMWNLLSNAVKFTPRRGRVEVHLGRVNSHVEIRVSDTGEGIAPDLLPVIFERFRQGDSSSTRAHGGLGIGLAVVRHLVELHGGTVTAESAGQGQGATFRVKLPVTIARTTETERHPGTGLEVRVASPTALAGLRVLVVEDDEDAAALMATILGAAGASVRTATSAKDAEVLFGAERPDVLVSDIEMPGTDGYTLIRTIRARSWEDGGHVPAIAVTAYSSVADRVRSLAAGFDNHLPKPVEPVELVATVARAAGRTLDTERT